MRVIGGRSPLPPPEERAGRRGASHAGSFTRDALRYSRRADSGRDILDAYAGTGSVGIEALAAARLTHSSWSGAGAR